MNETTTDENGNAAGGRMQALVMPHVDASTIKPAKSGKADFFSWQLYRWVKAKPHALQIWRGTWNTATGVDHDTPALYIGYMDETESGERWLHGRMLRNLCLHGQKLDGYAYGPGHDTAHWEEITEQWWEQYMQIGVCAIHGDYAHDWDENGDARTCRHCGKRERRTTKLVERTVWVDAA